MAPLLGTMEDMLKKALDGACFSIGGPFMSEGNLESGEGACIPETLNDE